MDKEQLIKWNLEALEAWMRGEDCEYQIYPHCMNFDFIEADYFEDGWMDDAEGYELSRINKFFHRIKPKDVFNKFQNSEASKAYKTQGLIHHEVEYTLVELNKLTRSECPKEEK